MAKRKIIKIDEKKCTGCSLCIPNCPEGALQIIDGKARLISDLFCDGLGACIGHCPEGAISIEERDAEAYDEKTVMLNIIKQGKNVIKAHLQHLKEHGENKLLSDALAVLKEKKIKSPLEENATHAPHTHGMAGCPGAKVMDFRKKTSTVKKDRAIPTMESELTQWPIQIMLVPPHAPYLNNCDLLIAADCVPFAYPNFHTDLLKGKVVLVGCPKLDDIAFYKERISQIVRNQNLKSITYVYMEVPCCHGMVNVIQSAISDSGKNIPFEDIMISIRGQILKHASKTS